MNWCPTHKAYSAKKEPNSLCGSCWRLWFYRCPEEQGKELMLEHIDWCEKNLAASGPRELPSRQRRGE